MMQPSAPEGGLRQLNAPDGIKADATPVGMAVKAGTKKWGPETKPGEEPPNAGGVLAGAAVRGIGGAVSRMANFATGQYSSQPGGGLADDTSLADDATEDVQ
jgi:hypothetical protein